MFLKEQWTIIIIIVIIIIKVCVVKLFEILDVYLFVTPARVMRV
jgi:hypothetical protein